MREYLTLIVEEYTLLQIGIDDKIPMTLWINARNKGFSGIGKIELDTLSFENFKKQIHNFSNREVNDVLVNDLNVASYYLYFNRIKDNIVIRGKIGDYDNQTLEFYFNKIDEDLINYEEIISFVNKIKQFKDFK